MYFADFIDWRTTHSADDLTTELLNAEFEDEKGVTRKLRRDELLHSGPEIRQGAID
jgi:hypothetical protein